MNKSLITNILALSLTIYGMFSPIYSTEIFMAGLFSLSGGLTNWLAIHMLFEKVPLLYGSGVIPDRFEEFKQGIRELILTEFFSLSSINNFLENKVSLKKNDLSKELDYDLIFTKLTEAIEESSLGSMLGMVGGKKALEPLKEPVKKKIREVVEDVSNKMVDENDKTAESVRKDLEEIIDQRLVELTSQHVKIIIKQMIHKHLGWLVVWGGVFGFFIGIILGLLGSLN
jgi:uncharacterized membrane protein YheB (UPF0754 family)|tara:strand:- start:1401 stop:2084 length:684 start_codon:yes stop_codon:yes gene_type:complete